MRLAIAPPPRSAAISALLPPLVRELEEHARGAA
jgi:hypothetical protein